ncbi:MAG: patatin family protein [Peptostreptococcus sp.]|uniref:patatin-like phospholipase family protein n=1 Tax=Peptostreptococcus sp. TaxID=1262 RepID=UPI002FC7B3A1
MELENNVKNIALIFEGGGMRGAFTAGIVNTLLENEIYFDYVSGISAGTSATLNYLSRDKKRTWDSFVELVDDPNFGGWKSFFKGNGFFNSEYIYEEIGRPGEWLEFDYETFSANPAKYRIVAYDVEENRARNFTNSDVSSLEDLMKIARASSSLPILMPSTIINDKIYYDGGLTGGIALDIAIEDGFDKFFIVRTQEKEYRKGPVKHTRFFKRHFKDYPGVAEALIERPQVYNNQCDRVEELERQGKAYVVYPEQMDITNRETNKEKLASIYQQGHDIGTRDIDKWKEFLFK